MNKLETLLNTLIQMGWKPWGILVDKILYIDSKFMLVCLDVIGRPKRQIKQDSLRELVSLESQLGQFCKKNGLCKKDKKYFREKVSKVGNNIGWFKHNYQYRLLESALVPEEELEKFLLDNIIVEGNSKYEIKGG